MVVTSQRGAAVVIEALRAEADEVLRVSLPRVYALGKAAAMLAAAFPAGSISGGECSNAAELAVLAAGDLARCWAAGALPVAKGAAPGIAGSPCVVSVLFLCGESRMDTIATMLPRAFHDACATARAGVAGTAVSVRGAAMAALDGGDGVRAAEGVAGASDCSTGGRRPLADGAAAPASGFGGRLAATGGESAGADGAGGASSGCDVVAVGGDHAAVDGAPAVPTLRVCELECYRSEITPPERLREGLVGWQALVAAASTGSGVDAGVGIWAFFSPAGVRAVFAAMADDAAAGSDSGAIPACLVAIVCIGATTGAAVREALAASTARLHPRIVLFPSPDAAGFEVALREVLRGLAESAGSGGSATGASCGDGVETA